jgi:hypothetical protein
MGAGSWGGGTAAREAGAAVGRKGRPEVGGDPDRWAPPVGGRVREREGSGPREEMGRMRWLGRR